MLILFIETDRNIENKHIDSKVEKTLSIFFLPNLSQKYPESILEKNIIITVNNKYVPANSLDVLSVKYKAIKGIIELLVIRFKNDPQSLIWIVSGNLKMTFNF